jgi:hypothetical protein
MPAEPEVAFMGGFRVINPPKRDREQHHQVRSHPDEHDTHTTPARDAENAINRARPRSTAESHAKPQPPPPIDR